MNNDDLLASIGKLIDQKLEPVNKRLDNTATKQDIAKLHTTLGQHETMLEAIKAGQESTKAELKADIYDLKVSLTRKVNDHEERITELEKEAGIPHPHKH